MRYKLIVQKIVEISEEEKRERKNMNIVRGFGNSFGDNVRENEVATIALDVELTEEEWNRVKSATIKEI